MESDKYLVESELRRWLTVLNYGTAPNEMEVDDVYAKIRKHRESLHLSNNEERLVFRDDFMLITFDYYLAMGPEHMRRVFTDLLRT